MLFEVESVYYLCLREDQYVHIDLQHHIIYCGRCYNLHDNVR